MTKKSDIMEVKTMKTTKSDIWCKNLSKISTIWNQASLAVTQSGYTPESTLGYF